MDEGEKPADQLEESTPNQAESTPEVTSGPPNGGRTDKPPGGRIKRFFHAYWAKKKLSLPLTILLLLVILLAVPFTRYKALGLFIKKNFTFVVVDSQTGRPVSEAAVAIAGRSGHTNGSGEVTIRQIPVGKSEATITKKYYRKQTADVLVGLSNNKNKRQLKFQATGRAVLIRVTNKINTQPIEDVSIAVLDTKAKTNGKGEATIVLPADKSTETAQVKADGFNSLTAEIEVTSQDISKNRLALTPAGKVYFLSNLSGTIDVVKTNLDGSDRQTVLAGTGQEHESETVLLATRDWKYLALKSRRDGEKAKLFLIETDTDELTVIDEGDADFEIYGWQDHNFVYKVTRNVEVSRPKRLALKSFNADNQALTTMRESAVESQNQYNYAYETFESINLLEENYLYIVNWNSCCSTNIADDNQRQIVQGKTGTTQANVLKGFSVRDSSSISSKPYEPNEIYYAVWAQSNYDFFEYDNGQIKAADIDEATFFSKTYPRYIQSPSGNALFWTEFRDGKNALFVGDGDAQNAEEIVSLSESTPYGWFTDSYLLVSKEGSELYIMANKKGATQHKITDYHRSTFNNSGYGGGY